jgi:prevent-host-death family protein
MICDPSLFGVQCSHIGGYKLKERTTMPQVGIRELKNDASEIIRAVREERAEYVVTLRGRPVAFIVPVDEARQEAEVTRRAAALRENAAFWDRMAALGAEIAAKWQSDKTAVELIDEQRR